MVGARLIGLLMPISFATILLALAVLIAASVACALDTMRLGARRSRWVVVLAGWVGLLVVGSAFGRTAEGFYKDRYAQAFTIPSGSMRDTLLVGDHVLVDKSAYRTGSPRRGDVVVFRYPPDERRHFIHRIVGMPGDTLQLRGPQVLINGKLLDEPYVRSRPPARGQTGPTACPYPHGCEALVIPPDAYFVMGDDRDNSQDHATGGS
jgi:signal peptidase I